MFIALTGTPGCGKTSATSSLPYRVVDINSLVKDGFNLGIDQKRGCLIADMDALKQWIARIDSDEIIILDGHFSHHFAKEAIVLRCAPSVLLHRLKARGYSDRKIKENLEAEALDVILVEAFTLCDKVHEIDATNMSSLEVAKLIVKIIQKKINLSPGEISWIDDIYWIERMDWTIGDGL